ncbi:MAG: thioredoxin TrxC [Pseudomonadales bacterium]|nr:thioredoxin TrxC [Pseudomonadales bacterium]
MNVVCPACGSANRVPEERLGDHPLCGKCKECLLPDHPVELVESVAGPYLQLNEQPVLVDFWAAWCGPCKMMAPNFKTAAEQMPGIRFAKVDTDAQPNLAARYQIRSIPTLILFHKGKEVARQSGVLTASQLRSWVEQHTAAA